MAQDVRPCDGEIRLQYYIVCLIDILGQQKALEGWARLPAEGQLSDGFVEAVRDTLGRVRGIRDVFQGFLSQFGKNPEPTAAFNRLSEADRQRLLQIRDAKISTQQFSDTFIFYTPITSSRGDISGAALHRILTAAATTLLAGLAGNAPIRGAIAVGAGVEIEAGNFYGPALADAHRLESEVAAYPRIVLSQAAVDLALRTGGFSADQVIEQVSAAYQQQHVGPLLCVDQDKRVIVDFMGHEVHSNVSHLTEVVDAASKAHAFVRSEAARFKAEGCAELAGRYARLLEYMESRLSIWEIAKEAEGPG